MVRLLYWGFGMLLVSLFVNLWTPLLIRPQSTEFMASVPAWFISFLGWFAVALMTLGTAFVVAFVVIRQLAKSRQGEDVPGPPVQATALVKTPGSRFLYSGVAMLLASLVLDFWTPTLLGPQPDEFMASIPLTVVSLLSWLGSALMLSGAALVAAFSAMRLHRIGSHRAIEGSRVSREP